VISWWCAVDHYEGRMKDIIHALKYERRRSISPRLGGLMRASAAELLRDVDAAIPVPLHWRREYERGFNQAEDLARYLGVPLARMLSRTANTRSQIDLPRDQRRRNVRNAFALSERSKATVVVLVDDVATTGATLESCAAVLLKAGVREVRALTAARVV
jgi:ComF family protein